MQVVNFHLANATPDWRIEKPIYRAHFAKITFTKLSFFVKITPFTAESSFVGRGSLRFRTKKYLYNVYIMNVVFQVNYISKEDIISDVNFYFLLKFRIPTDGGEVFFLINKVTFNDVKSVRYLKISTDVLNLFIILTYI